MLLFPSFIPYICIFDIISTSLLVLPKKKR